MQYFPAELSLVLYKVVSMFKFRRSRGDPFKSTSQFQMKTVEQFVS